MSTTIQRRSQHNTYTENEAPQAAVSEGLTQGPNEAARVEFKPTTLQTKDAKSTYALPCPLAVGLNTRLLNQNQTRHCRNNCITH